jgi:hypothetical protein
MDALSRSQGASLGVPSILAQGSLLPQTTLSVFNVKKLCDSCVSNCDTLSLYPILD